VKPGIGLLHKPVGPTSFSMVQALRQERRGPASRLPVCHAGTLDPFAEGLLVVLAGAATKLMDALHALPKVYEAEVVWGVETDTGDAGGKVVSRANAEGLTADALDQALHAFVGWTLQVPPATSAKKVGGEPAYKKAHRGEPVTLPASRVYLHQARWLSHQLPQGSRLSLCCRGGYYVRALARDLGRQLGVPAHLSGLTRVRIGPWEDPPPGPAQWFHGPGAFPWWPTRVVSPDEAYALKEGRTIPGGQVAPAPWCVPDGFPTLDERVLAVKDGRAIALLAAQGMRWMAALRLPAGI
jgi:tRNA pseudouridine55 synthase